MAERSVLVGMSVIRGGCPVFYSGELPATGGIVRVLVEMLLGKFKRLAQGRRRRAINTRPQC